MKSTTYTVQNGEILANLDSSEREYKQESDHYGASKDHMSVCTGAYENSKCSFGQIQPDRRGKKSAGSGLHSKQPARATWLNSVSGQLLHAGENLVFVK
jgi:hypothetical protein